MKKTLLIFAVIVFGLNFLNSSQSKPERTFTIKKCNKTKAFTLTLIDKDGDFRFDEAVETFCDSCKLTLPVKIKTKYKNDPIPELGDIAVVLDSCETIKLSNCEKLKIQQGIISKPKHHHIEGLSFVITFFDEFDNVKAVASQSCGNDTLFITGAMCNVKFGDE